MTSFPRLLFFIFLLAFFIFSSSGKVISQENSQEKFGPRVIYSPQLYKPHFEISPFSQQKNLLQNNETSAKELSSGVRILLAALVPGLPQHFDGKVRSYGYFAAEAISITGLLVFNGDGKSFRNQYYNLARTARSNYVYPGYRNNTLEESDPMLPGFGEYYEDMMKWPSSGDYDNDQSLEGIQPETDPRTYNGHQWEIARINNYSESSGGIPVPASSAEEQAALEAYKRQVYPIDYNWDWTGLEQEQDEYHRLFDKSESAFRKRGKFLAILLANHMVSTLDIIISERIKKTGLLEKNRLQVHLEMYHPSYDPTSFPVPAIRLSRSF